MIRFIILIVIVTPAYLSSWAWKAKIHSLKWPYDTVSVIKTFPKELLK